MKQITLIVLGWIVLSCAAHAASFDCAKAATKVEKLICGDSALSKLDEELNAAYKTALQDEKQADSTKQAQMQWIKERNKCADTDCLSKAYRARTRELSASNTANNKAPAFTLLKGKGVPVCEAYLKRLNISEWGSHEKLPTCGRPENDSVEGFTVLNRVPLTAEQIAALYGGVTNFLNGGHSDRGNNKPSDPHPIIRVRQSIEDNGLAVWRYDPPVDIDNDGKPDDDLIVWQGGLGVGPCGRRAGAADEVLILPTHIYSINWQQMKLNDERTRELFGHPVGGYPVVLQGKPVMSNRFRPIGTKMGIFSYQDQYYFETFFDGWGDFEGKRRSDWGDGKRRIKNSLAGILGVFQRKDGVTKQICEYRWNEFEQYYR